MNILGIDVGGSGIKGAIVNTVTGELVSDRYRLETPKPATPANVADTVKKLVNMFDYNGYVGCSFPTVIINGKAITKGNIHKSWIGVQVDKLFENETGLPFIVYNDADLAGMAEIQLGNGKNLQGTVIMVTIGTGLGTGVFFNGILIPNIELGRVLGKDGQPIEFFAGDKARKDNDLSWKAWAKRFDFFLNHIVRVFSPSYFILGGGASKKFPKYETHITVDTPILVAKFKNNAGIIGAAIAAAAEQNLMAQN